MSLKTAHTAVLVFALSPKEQQKQKPLKKGDLLFDALTKTTLSEVKKTQLPYVYCTEETQTGSTFGERYTNALHSMFEAGYTNVISVGNDCPYLKSKHLLEAAQALASGENVLGPTTDNGFYLLGIQKEVFEPKVFKELPWQTNHLLGATLAYFKKQERVPKLLMRFSDIDHVSDIITILKRPKSISVRLRNLLRVIVDLVAKPNFYVLKRLFCTSFDIPFNKGSPSFLLSI